MKYGREQFLIKSLSAIKCFVALKSDLKKVEQSATQYNITE